MEKCANLIARLSIIAAKWMSDIRWVLSSQQHIREELYLPDYIWKTSEVKDCIWLYQTSPDYMPTTDRLSSGWLLWAWLESELNGT